MTDIASIITVFLLPAALIGWAIGRAKGRPVVGVALGVALGPIGWIVTAVLPRTVEAEAVRIAKMRAMLGNG